MLIVLTFSNNTFGQGNIYDCAIISEWQTTQYSVGDLVSDGEKVYECKSWPYSQWAGLNNAYQPPIGMAWEHAWTEVGICSTSPDYVDCDNLSEWEYTSYDAGALIVADDYIYKCKPWPYCGWCGSNAAYEPAVGANWQMAWNKVGSCEVYTITATAGTGGKIIPEGTIEVNGDVEKTFYIIPDQGKTIADVVVNGNSVGPVSTFSLSANNGNDAAITAIFSGSANIPPVAVENHVTVTDYDGNGFEAVYLDASGSYDVDGTIVKYFWEIDMGNGRITYLRFVPYVNDQNDLPIGEMVATLWVTDNDGAKSAGCIFKITVLRP